jgi:ketosteroid isomerase-like protein
MSKENVEIAKRVQPSGIDMVRLLRAPTPQALADAGVDLTAFESDFETEFISRHGGPIRPSSRGVLGFQGFVEGWLDWLQAWESYVVDVDGFIDAGDEVVSLVRVKARVGPDAVPVEHRPAAVWSFRAGKVSHVRFYLERDEALGAAGLSE